MNQQTAADLRRAAVLIKHYAHGNHEGINVILTEAVDAKRPAHLIQGVLSTYDAIIPQLVTQAGQRCMAEMLITFATNNTDFAPEWNRAARFLLALGEGHTDTANEIIGETDNVSPTLIALLDIYSSIVPLVCTPFGMEIIDRGIQTLAGLEAETTE